MTDEETRLVAFRIADLLEVGIVVGRHKGVALTVAGVAVCELDYVAGGGALVLLWFLPSAALAAALLRSAPSAMVAMPAFAVVVDLDAEAFLLLARALPPVPAFLADPG